MADTPKTRTIPRRRRVVYALVGASLLLALLFAVGELLARWQVEGSFAEAITSIFGGRGVEDSASTTWFVPDERLGFRLNPARESINASGFRSNGEIGAKTAGRLRLLAIGDSVSFPHDGYVARFEQGLGRSVEVINAAIPGFTSYQERLFLEEELLDLEPDLVVLQYCLNDNHRFLHRVTKTGRRLITQDAKARLFGDEDSWAGWLTRRSYLVFSLRKAMLGEEQGSGPIWDDPVFGSAWDERSWQDAAEQFTAMAAACRQRGATLAVIAVPHERQLEAGLDASSIERMDMPQRQLRAICESLDIPFADLLPRFRAEPEATLYTDQIHLSDRGHDVAAEELLAFLKRERLLP